MKCGLAEIWDMKCDQKTHHSVGPVGLPLESGVFFTEKLTWNLIHLLCCSSFRLVWKLSVEVEPNQKNFLVHFLANSVVTNNADHLFRFLHYLLVSPQNIQEINQSLHKHSLAFPHVVLWMMLHVGSCNLYCSFCFVCNTSV